MFCLILLIISRSSNICCISSGTNNTLRHYGWYSNEQDTFSRLRKITSLKAICATMAKSIVLRGKQYIKESLICTKEGKNTENLVEIELVKNIRAFNAIP